MIDREGAALLAQVGATFFVALAVNSLVVHRDSNPIRKIDTTVEVTTMLLTLFVTAGATAIAVFDLETTVLTPWLLGVPSVVAVLGIANLMHGVITDRWSRASDHPEQVEDRTEGASPAAPPLESDR